MFEVAEVRAVRRGNRESCAGLADAVCDVVGEVAAHAGQLAGGVEVADERHVRVGGVAVLVEQQLPGEQQHLGDPDLGAASAGRRGRRPRGTPPGVLSVDRHLLGEERVGDVEHLRREDRRPARP